MWNEGAEYITLHIPELRGKREEELFAVRVKGDSMEPTLRDGDIVVFWTGGAPEPGRIVAVHVHWDGVIVKRLQRYNGSWYLYSDNPDHPPVPLTENDRVLGVAATLVRKM
ncbi:signal peptidase I [Thermus aquaticus Y51MC23]|uniref:Signal peptidase I n=2 Tax=Thermus aquaticus TaxID=271 RepID=A0ABN4IEV4_THEA5|nr:signal peptidase I [Thermus aquaticus Y51MC23]